MRRLKPEEMEVLKALVRHYNRHWWATKMKMLDAVKVAIRDTGLPVTRKRLRDAAVNNGAMWMVESRPRRSTARLGDSSKWGKIGKWIDSQQFNPTSDTLPSVVMRINRDGIRCGKSMVVEMLKVRKITLPTEPEPFKAVP